MEAAFENLSTLAVAEGVLTEAQVDAMTDTVAACDVAAREEAVEHAVRRCLLSGAHVRPGEEHVVH